MEFNFIDFLLQILYVAVVIVLGGAVVFFCMWLYVRLKRWYGITRIVRNEKDFKTTSVYIRRCGKKINRFQRMFLTQFGSIPNCYDVLLLAVSMVVGILIGLLIGAGVFAVYNFLDIKLGIIPQGIKDFIEHVPLFLEIIFELVLIALWVLSFKLLIKRASFLQFMISSTILLGYSFMLINVFINLFVV